MVGPLKAVKQRASESDFRIVLGIHFSFPLDYSFLFSQAHGLGCESFPYPLPNTPPLPLSAGRRLDLQHHGRGIRHLAVPLGNARQATHALLCHFDKLLGLVDS
jgi:hypothetical protein